MTAALPSPTGSLVTLAGAAAVESAAGESPDLWPLVKQIEDAGSAAERADRHVQKWRDGLAKLLLEMQLNPDLDAARVAMTRTPGWKVMAQAALESPAIMAELRSYWKPEDEVRVP